MENVIIRAARPEDGPALLEIYRPYVESTAITFEYDVPTAGEFTRRVEKTLERYPYLAAWREGELLGYAYASQFHERAAYDWAVETSIYIKRGLHGQGLGKALYAALEEVLKRQNVQNLNACIAYPNPQSVAFHQRLGYQMAGRFHQCGFKLGRWWDMVWMEKHIGGHDGEPGAFVPFSQIDKASGNSIKTGRSEQHE